MRYLLASIIAFILYTVDNVSAAFLNLKFLSDSPASQRFVQNFQNAAREVDEIITSNLPAVSTRQLSNRCGFKISTELNRLGQFENMQVFVNLINIDGVSGILGRAGPCAFQGNSPRVCQVELDLADVANLDREGVLEIVIVHEFYHCVGIGTTWGSLVVRDAFFRNPVYIGANGKEGFVNVGGPLGADVPVENNGRPGSDGSHWRESVFTRELMSSNLSPSTSLSLLTVKSLKDLGYTVNENSPLINKNYRYNLALRGTDTLRGAKISEHAVHMGSDVLNFFPDMNFTYHI